MIDEYKKYKWPVDITVSAKDRYIKNNGGGVWKIDNVDFVENYIALSEVSGNGEWSLTGQDLLESFTKIE